VRPKKFVDCYLDQVPSSWRRRNKAVIGGFPACDRQGHAAGTAKASVITEAFADPAAGKVTKTHPPPRPDWWASATNSADADGQKGELLTGTDRPVARFALHRRRIRRC